MGSECNEKVFVGVENVLELDSGNGCTISDCPKTTELYL